MPVLLFSFYAFWIESGIFLPKFFLFACLVDRLCACMVSVICIVFSFLNFLVISVHAHVKEGHKGLAGVLCAWLAFLAACLSCGRFGQSHHRWQDLEDLLLEWLEVPGRDLIHLHESIILDDNDLRMELEQGTTGLILPYVDILCTHSFNPFFFWPSIPFPTPPALPGAPDPRVPLEGQFLQEVHHHLLLCRCGKRLPWQWQEMERLGPSKLRLVANIQPVLI